METMRNLSARRSSQGRKSFLVEALILLAILMTAVAVFMSLFSSAERMGIESATLDRAVLLATSTAERFAADPFASGLSRTEDDLEVTCVVTPEKGASGVLYQAVITVVQGENELYSLSTARYVSGVR